MSELHDFYNPLDANSTCELKRFCFVWGRNLLADSEFVTVVAGVYGLLQPSVFDGSWRAFSQYGALAALFAMATVEERESVQTLVRPKVNTLYVMFMSLPLILCLCIVAIARLTRRYCLPIPSTPWELMVLAKSERLVRGLDKPDDPFPPCDGDLGYVFYDAQQQLHGHGHAIVRISEVIKTPSDSNQGSARSLDSVSLGPSFRI